MTVEHRVVLGLKDLKAVILECKKCGVRVSMSPDAITTYRDHGECKYCEAEWWRIESQSVMRGVQSPYHEFLQSIMVLRKEEAEGFRILFEVSSSLSASA